MRNNTHINHFPPTPFHRTAPLYMERRIYFRRGQEMVVAGKAGALDRGPLVVGVDRPVQQVEQGELALVELVGVDSCYGPN